MSMICQYIKGFEVSRPTVPDLFSASAIRYIVRDDLDPDGSRYLGYEATTPDDNDDLEASNQMPLGGGDPAESAGHL